MESVSVKLAFRPAGGRDSADRDFIIATWSSSFKKSHSAGLIHADDWAAVMRPQLERILDRGRAVIACDKTDPNYFYGWIAGDTSESTPVIFYAYVKEPYRRTGIGRDLFAAFGVDPTKYFVYVCKPVSIVLLGKVRLARFNPNEVRYPKENRRRPL
ncbi:MAG: hypothetical protein HOV80_36155 [Polyangiaceae bacterium]|nr:hypothetical protein [Polyangiaceae bacterium]